MILKKSATAIFEAGVRAVAPDAWIKKQVRISSANVTDMQILLMSWFRI
ncbi:MAG: hypothetical protein H0S81_07215 [Desulfotignum balticum]|jgi:hypothetical protein|uniref:Uncharacterized protein n=1 Tax=Desulfotignum balticum TaxID=115781 RepID=A0A931G8V2_9BACT|nr:hypothetical protein [Desulfotignum balticum]